MADNDKHNFFHLGQVSGVHSFQFSIWDGWGEEYYYNETEYASYRSKLHRDVYYFWPGVLTSNEILQLIYETIMKLLCLLSEVLALLLCIVARCIFLQLSL